MRILEPLFLLLLPLPVMLAVLRQKLETGRTVRFTGTAILSDVVKQSSRLPTILLTVAAVLTLVPLSEPRLSAIEQADRANVVLVIDVSGSMSADDVEPTRLDAARSAATDFAENMPDNWRIGVVAFSDQPFLLVQPTVERQDVARNLSTLVAQGGTSTGDALDLAIDVGRAGQAERIDEALDKGDDLVDPASAVIVLLSDGAQTTGTIDAISAAERARNLDIPIHTIALGTDLGKIDVVFPDGQVRPIDVPPDLPTAARVAEITGGRFFSALTAEDLKEVYQSVNTSLEEDRTERDLSIIFLVLAGVCAATSLFVGRTRGRRRTAPGRGNPPRSDDALGPTGRVVGRERTGVPRAIPTRRGGRA